MGKFTDSSSVSAGDKAAAKRAMGVIAPIIIIGMAAWTFGAVYFMNMIFTKIGTSRGLIGQTATEDDAESTYIPITAAEAVRMVCRSGEYRYDFYQDNNYEMAYVGQPYNLDAGTYTISGETITMTSKEEGVVIDANYAEHILLVGHEAYSCKEYDGA